MRRPPPRIVQLITWPSVSRELATMTLTPSLVSRRVARGPISMISPRTPFSSSTKSPTWMKGSNTISMPATKSRTTFCRPRLAPIATPPSTTASELRSMPTRGDAQEQPRHHDAVGREFLDQIDDGPAGLVALAQAPERIDRDAGDDEGDGDDEGGEDHVQRPAKSRRRVFTQVQICSRPISECMGPVLRARAIPRPPA